MNTLTQGIPLGRWFGTTVVVSFWHLIMLYLICSRADAPVICGVVFFLSILLHEFGHAFACKAVKGRADLIVMGPMGGLTVTQPPNTAFAHFVSTAGGPLVNLVILGAAWALSQMESVQRVAAQQTQLSHIVEWGLFYSILINKLLLILNLLPLFPMDGGNLMWHILWPIVGYKNSMQITGMIGTVGGGALAIVGTGLVPVTIPLVGQDFGRDPSIFLIIIGITCAVDSFALYRRSQEMGDWRKN